MAGDVFKSVMLLQGIPVDTFFEAMGMFANSMGNDCTFCHVSEAVFDKAKFAESTPRIMKARQMIVMMNAINKTVLRRPDPRDLLHLPRRQRPAPERIGSRAPVRGTGVRSERARDSRPDPRMSANQVFDKYIQALGGADRLAKLTSYVAKGSYSGFDTSLDEDSRGNLRRGAEPDDDGHASRDRQQHQGVQRPQRVDGRPRHAAAAGDADGRQSGPRAARGHRGVSSRDSAGVQRMAGWPSP